MKKYSWDVDQITSQLRSIAREISNPYNDGFIGWGCKQDLYQIKMALEELMRDLPTFSGETEWLAEQEKKRIIKILKG